MANRSAVVRFQAWRVELEPSSAVLGWASGDFRVKPGRVVYQAKLPVSRRWLAELCWLTRTHVGFVGSLWWTGLQQVWSTSLLRATMPKVCNPSRIFLVSQRVTFTHPTRVGEGLGC